MSITTEIQRLQNAKADIKTAIENKGVEVGDGLINTYAEKISQISGGSEVIDFARYASTFALATTEGLPETVTFNFDRVKNLYAFYQSKENLTVKHFILNCSQPLTDIQYLFSNTNQTNIVEHITLNADTSQIKRWTQPFYGKKNLKIIDGEPLNLSSATHIYAPFDLTAKLEEVRFVEESIPLSLSLAGQYMLSAETVQSVIDGLKDLTGQSPMKLTLHKNIGEKLTDEQKAAITAKNWTLVLY